MKQSTDDSKARVNHRTLRNGLFLPVALSSGLFFCTAIALITQAYNHSEPKPAAIESAPAIKPGTLTGAAQGGPAQQGPVQVVQFAVYDVGIYPYEARVTKGLIAITFEDISGGPSDLVVERETGAAPESVGRVHREHNPRGRSDLRLDPGRYQVFVADHPQNRATLIVEP